ncbi:hypothetical protein FA15DRAFT_700379 [Coprinopsis marcescibilis]|uniref:Uncharacterized protein n=1 Tax=Coprinopsis marcescibilis TaxID=230819 RepID=A0A5C3L7U5_COPMA|nr:hypothetical protein FA15DRAFT_700379 [Coprinopsis marcescibilis]
MSSSHAQHTPVRGALPRPPPIQPPRAMSASGVSTNTEGRRPTVYHSPTDMTSENSNNDAVSPSSLRQHTILSNHSVIDVPPQDPPLEPQRRTTVITTDSTPNIFAHEGGLISLDDPRPAGTPGHQQSSNDVQAKPMSVNRLRWWIGMCVAFVVLAPVISVAMGMTLHARDMQYPGPPQSAEFQGRTVRAAMVWIVGYWRGPEAGDHAA